MTSEIKLIPSDNLISIIPLVQLLNPSLPASILEARLQEMTFQGYQCAGLYIDGHLIGIWDFGS